VNALMALRCVRGTHPYAGKKKAANATASLFLSLICY
jgi:hypothetical protein